MGTKIGFQKHVFEIFVRRGKLANQATLSSKTSKGSLKKF
jgi:hypothetical protein